jgi:hypothetical protein
MPFRSILGFYDLEISEHFPYSDEGLCLTERKEWLKGVG